MLDYDPQPLGKMKARFLQAVEFPVDSEAVLSGRRLPPSSERKHVFDFEDGMRIIVSIDKMDNRYFMHCSASGTKEYADTIKSDGLPGMIEDILLRLAAMSGGPPGNNIQSMMTERGVMHIMFEVNHGEFVNRVKRA